MAFHKRNPDKSGRRFITIDETWIHHYIKNRKIGRIYTKEKTMSFGEKEIVSPWKCTSTFTNRSSNWWQRFESNNEAFRAVNGYFEELAGLLHKNYINK